MSEEPPISSDSDSREEKPVERPRLTLRRLRSRPPMPLDEKVGFEEDPSYVNPPEARATSDYLFDSSKNLHPNPPGKGGTVPPVSPQPEETESRASEEESSDKPRLHLRLPPADTAAQSGSTAPTPGSDVTPPSPGARSTSEANAVIDELFAASAVDSDSASPESTQVPASPISPPSDSSLPPKKGLPERLIKKPRVRQIEPEPDVDPPKPLILIEPPTAVPPPLPKGSPPSTLAKKKAEADSPPLPGLPPKPPKSTFSSKAKTVGRPFPKYEDAGPSRVISTMQRATAPSAPPSGPRPPPPVSIDTIKPTPSLKPPPPADAPVIRSQLKILSKMKGSINRIVRLGLLTLLGFVLLVSAAIGIYTVYLQLAPKLRSGPVEESVPETPPKVVVEIPPEVPSVAVSPEVPASTSSVAADVSLNQEFINSLSLSMVRNRGVDSMIVIDSVVYHIGDVLEPVSGLRFMGFSSNGQRLLFEDASGQLYQRGF